MFNCSRNSAGSSQSKLAPENQPMVKHTSLILLRLFFAYIVFRAMAFAHVRSGAQYPGDGQQAFGFVAFFLVLGAVAALIYFVLGSMLQFLRRRKSGYSILLVDALLCLLFAGALTFAGATANYTQTPPVAERTDFEGRLPSAR